MNHKPIKPTARQVKEVKLPVAKVQPAPPQPPPLITPEQADQAIRKNMSNIFARLKSGAVLGQNELVQIERYRSGLPMSIPTSEGYIQHGQVKPHKKARHDEVDRRIEFTKQLLGERKAKHEIRDIFKEQFNLEWHQADRYIAWARESLAKKIGKERPDLALEAFAFYQRIIQDPAAEMDHKLEAQACIRKMLALDIPQANKVELSGPEGAPIQTQNDSRVLQKLDISTLDSIINRLAKEVGDTTVRRPLLLDVIPSNGGNGNGHD